MLRIVREMMAPLVLCVVRKKPPVFLCVSVVGGGNDPAVPKRMIIRGARGASSPLQGCHPQAVFPRTCTQPSCFTLTLIHTPGLGIPLHARLQCCCISTTGW